MIIPKKTVVGGKRKTAIAKATIIDGTGEVYINKIPYQNLDFFKKLEIMEPIEIAKGVFGDLKYDIYVNVKSGGSSSQIHASRLAIARALVKYTKSDELKKAYVKYDKNMLVADTRRKEANKPGDSKARRMRQKSFR
ncbi:30S ribosomal protein S9 [Candidatus Pacearchaeota archaeon]|nr:30S ribosomal protein S9 [Candidatus Pacearchaeota archaeon]